MDRVYLDASGLPRSIDLNASGVPRSINLDVEDLVHQIRCFEGSPLPYNAGKAFGEGLADALTERFPWLKNFAPEKL